ncbi:hypothetical protein C489_06193 [Natrinema versiforme JCM 10478]|uniref:Uncharacterized protein n=1 Tax=Natrinema versiforme JCM 10478 TaxID=1227496 RepID=L9Y4C3_9EURY|nr:hypothetical protein C489_06193 [Natrinema versiforme JCM 10478]
MFGLFATIVSGLWLLATSSVDTSGSSAPVVGPALTVLTSVWTVPVLALWLTRRWVFFRRGRNASVAADVTGWTVATIKHLRDEIQTTDGCTRVIATTDDDREAIAERIDAALEGDRGDDTVAFWDSPSDPSDPEDIIADAEEPDETNTTDAGETDQTRREQLLERERELVGEYNRKADRVGELVDDALAGEIDPAKLLEADGRASMQDLMDDATSDAVDEADRLISECEDIESELDSVRDELAAIDEAASDIVVGIADAYALDDALFEAGYSRAEYFDGDESGEDRSLVSRLCGVPRRVAGAVVGVVSRDDDPDDSDDETDVPDEYQIPWRVRFLEEIKHLWLDLQSGFRTGDGIVRFGVPAAVALTLQLFVAGLWTTLPVYVLIGATSTLVGLGYYWINKRRRQRRLRRYRTHSSTNYWLDCAGQFKTVETADVTAYMGFIAGRRYASYEREEFVRKTSRTMHQHVSDECVAPSDLQHYARCLEQMKPNLKGHRQNVLQPLIMRDVKRTVEAAEDDLIPKAELAWSVIEQPSSSRIERRLGHDPELVGAEYQYLVEDAHVLDEREVEFMDANGDVQTITLVFPAEKNRLPDVSERHSQFSDRFTDRKGEPVYELPDVDPRDELQGFVPSPDAAALFDGNHSRATTQTAD